MIDDGYEMHGPDDRLSIGMTNRHILEQRKEMTQPNAQPKTAPNVPQNAAPAKPQPAAPLTDEQLRLQAVTLAVQAGVIPTELITIATRITDYIKRG